MRKKSLFILIGLLVLLAGCGGVKNETPFEAAETVIRGLINEDVELLDGVNRSEELSYPTDHLLKIAEERGFIHLKFKDIEFSDGLRENQVMVEWKDTEGNEQYSKMNFIEEDGLYYFDSLSY